jgi:hypothetical protein
MIANSVRDRIWRRKTKMKKKIVGILICMLMIVATVLPVTSTSNLDNNLLKEQGVSSNDKSPVSLQANHCLWSGIGSNLTNTAKTPAFTVPITNILTLWKQYEIHSPDEAYIEISADGGMTWTVLEFINGYQADWKQNFLDLSAYEGLTVIIGFVYNTVSNSQSKGWHIDAISFLGGGSGTYVEDFETGAPGWILNGWTIVEKHAPPITKWEQLPDTTDTGIDICTDTGSYPYYPRLLTDDFQCKSSGWITNISLWGSWLFDNKFTMYTHLSIYADIPANQSQTGYSMPGAMLWERYFAPGEFEESIYYNGTSEWWWDPYKHDLVQNADHIIYRYDFSIPKDQAFYQNGTSTNPVTYWLGLNVNSTNGTFGWKTSWQHWNDDATYKISASPWWYELMYPMGHPYQNQSIDMAFRITTTTPTCCFKITWPTYNQTIKCACFKINFTETCNENHINVPWSITITNHGPGMLRCLPPFSSPLAPTQSRTYSHVFFMFGAGKTKTRCSPILWAAIYYPPYPPGVPGLRSITITVTVDGCPPVMQTAKVGWFTISIP